jgi:hypothetical protein
MSRLIGSVGLTFVLSEIRMPKTLFKAHSWVLG